MESGTIRSVSRGVVVMFRIECTTAHHPPVDVIIVWRPAVRKGMAALVTETIGNGTGAHLRVYVCVFSTSVCWSRVTVAKPAIHICKQSAGEHV